MGRCLSRLVGGVGAWASVGVALTLALACVMGTATASAELVFREGPPIRAAQSSAEVVHLSADGNLMLQTDPSDDEGLYLVDVSNLADPVELANVDFASEGLSLTSATFSADEQFVLAVYDGGETNHQLIVLERDGGELSVARRMPLPAQPDSIEVSADDKYAAIAIEDEDKRLPGGVMEIVRLADPDDPATWTLHDVPIVLDASYAENTEPQPEYVDFNADNEVAVSIQEQSAIGIIDAAAAADGNPATDPVETIFHAGTTNFPDDGNLGDSIFAWNPATPNLQPRQPDAVAWTADGQAIAAVAEGETSDPHEWDIYDREGKLLYASGESLNRNAALYGQHPVNYKNTQPEGMTIETYKGHEYAFIVNERTASMHAYDLTDSLANPKLVGVFPTGIRPETVAFSPDRGIAFAANETDGFNPVSTVRLIDRTQSNSDRPLLIADEPWVNMRGLAATGANRLLAVSSELPHKLRQIDLSSRGEARMTTLATLPGSAATQAVEDLVSDGQGGAWITTASAGLMHVAANGSLLQTIASPVSSPTGIALTADGSSLVVINTSGAAARIALADSTVTKFTVTTTVAGQFTDLSTAPDATIVALRANTYNTASGAGATALVSFPADAAAGATVAATTKRTLTAEDQTQYGSERATALAIAANGDAWYGNGASLNGNNGSDAGLRRLKGIFFPAPPAPAPDQGLPSSRLGDPFLGLRYFFAGGETYATGVPGQVIADKDASHGPNVAIFDPETGPVPGLSALSSAEVVKAIAPDGSGGFYMGGGFPAEADPERRALIKHVLADGSIDPSFVSPSTVGGLSGRVDAIAFAGGRLWIAGHFDTINGVPRNGLAALNLDGSLDKSVDLPVSDPGAVRNLIAAGGKLYVGGESELVIAGQERPYIGRIDPISATVEAFNPLPNNTVTEVAVDGSRTVLGGAFTTIGGSPATRLAIVDGSSGALLADLKAGSTFNSAVKSIAIQGRKLWVGGLFTTLNGVAANRIGAIDLDSPENVTGFPAGKEPAGEVSLVLPLANGDVLFVAGEVVVFDPATMSVRPSSHPVAVRGSGAELGLQLAPDRIVVAGTFTLLGEVGPQRSLSRITPDGDFDPSFNPPADFKPTVLAADDDYLYSTTGIRLDRQTGEVDPTWSFAHNWTGEGDEAAMLVRGSDLYVLSQDVKTINGLTRKGIGAVNRTTGATTAFNARADGNVWDALLTPGGRMFISGEFTHLGAQSATGVAEVDPDSGAKRGTLDGVKLATGRHPIAFDHKNQILYVGNVYQLNGQPAGGIVAYDVSGSTATQITSFQPQVVATRIINLRWIAGDLVVRTEGSLPVVNGTTLDSEKNHVDIPGGFLFTLTSSGQLDSAFTPATGEGNLIQSNGSAASILGHLYLPAPPAANTAPTLSGTPAVGQQLTCANGSWDAAPTSYAYSWQRDGAEIPDAGSSTYTVAAADDGRALRCGVTATNPSGSTTAFSGPIAVITPGAPCTGASIVGAGSAAQGLAHLEAWKPGFEGGVCNEGAKPTIAYDPRGSAAAMNEWNADGARGSLNTDLAFIGSDEAPSAAQIANIESVAGGAKLAVIPVAQTAIAIVANPPAGCNVSSIRNANLEAVMEGRIITWAKIEGATGAACAAPITRVVPRDTSGATAQLKLYLSTFYPQGLQCTSGSTEGKASWSDLATASTNTQWPESCTAQKKDLSTLARPALDGEAAVVKQVGTTSGSIGFAPLPVAAANLGGSSVLVSVQSNGLKKLSNAEFAAPALAGAANCGAVTYKVPKSSSGLSVDWSAVVGTAPTTGGNNYPLCMLTYALALDDYQAAGFSAGQRVTVRDYLGSYVVQAAGQSAALGHGFALLPSSSAATRDVLAAARQAAATIGG